jgi:phospholipid transport system substrate-binding protein
MMKMAFRSRWNGPKMKAIRPSLFILILSIFISNHSFADPDGALDFIQREQTNLKKLVDTRAASDKVLAKIDSMVDYDEITNRTLGVPCPVNMRTCTNWKTKLTNDQYLQISSRVEKIVQNNYQRNLDKLRDYDLAYRGAREQGQNLTKVLTRAKHKSDPRKPLIQVDYMVLNLGNRYWVIDVLVEGQSITEDYYDQFNRILSRPDQGFNYLIQRLDQALNQNDHK